MSINVNSFTLEKVIKKLSKEYKLDHPKEKKKKDDKVKKSKKDKKDKKKGGKKYIEKDESIYVTIDI